MSDRENQTRFQAYIKNDKALIFKKLLEEKGLTFTEWLINSIDYFISTNKVEKKWKNLQKTIDICVHILYNIIIAREKYPN